MRISSTGRSLGLKLFLLGAIVLALGIPLFFIGLLSWERSERADAAALEVGQAMGGPQTVRGPFLAIPYSVDEEVWDTARDGRRTRRVEHRTRHVFVSPQALDIAVTQDVGVRHRGIYDIPVYSADIAAQGVFEIPGSVAGLPEGVEPDWEGVRVVLALSDLRAIARPVTMTVEGRGPVAFEPGAPASVSGWRAISGPAGRVTPGEQIAFSLEASVTGAQWMRFAASGRDTRLTLRSNWPHPGFDGGFLPDTHTISATGFEAEWDIPYLARGVQGEWISTEAAAAVLDQQAFGVSLVAPADGYQQVGRALKYGLFFVGLLVLTIFLIEARTGRRIHPAQYILMGMAQVIFYLLLLALSEHAGSLPAYLVAALATVGLSGAYAASAFADRRTGLAVGLAMAVVYATQFALLMVEDYALLIGAVMAFLALAGAMVFTRGIDWYGSNDADAGSAGIV